MLRTKAGRDFAACTALCLLGAVMLLFCGVVI